MITINNIDGSPENIPETYKQQHFDGNYFYFLETDEEVTSFQSLKIPIVVNGKFVEGATQDDIVKEQIDSEYLLYVKRQKDGQDYHLRICAELRIMKLSGSINQAQYDIIYTILGPTRNEVVTGNWLSGLKELEKVQSSLSPTLYDRLHLDISTYISENY